MVTAAIGNWQGGDDLVMLLLQDIVGIVKFLFDHRADIRGGAVHLHGTGGCRSVRTFILPPYFLPPPTPVRFSTLFSSPCLRLEIFPEDEIRKMNDGK